MNTKRAIGCAVARGALAGCAGSTQQTDAQLRARRSR